MKGLKKVLILIMVVLMVFTWTACSNSDGKDNTSNNGDNNIESTETVYPLTVVDDLGNEVIFEKAPEKIVSISPSNTEILFALGLGDKVIGRDNYSNYPEEAQDIEVVGDYDGPNTEAIIDLDPNVVFAFRSIPEDIKQLLEASEIKLVVFNSSSIDDVFKSIETIGQITNVKEKSDEVIDNMKNEREEIITKLKDVKSKKVFIDLGDFYSVGPDSFIDSMLQEINASNIASDADTPYPQLSLEKVIEANPDIYISTFTSAEDIKKLEGIQAIDAFKNDDIVEITSGTPENDIIQRPGPRVIDGLEIYAKAIYPEVFEE
ncbi:ABC transporter substrate-binding protein [Clostridium sp. D2Q-14]|uniref:ABC transporter substrate-binding protein n=1 Tax=Anaeromonas gelatinilytica TaxID=2683194 RepID=UPI00193BF18C|nr:ABC transporter substrate-binding protein [Anaeromonas gelatinilytica]MBS4534101.1 ABC transporter substrate-binding protein [Anaeromonas gelatinilytica]